MSDLRARLTKILLLHGKALSEAIGQREHNNSFQVVAQFETNDLLADALEVESSSASSLGSQKTQLLDRDLIQRFADNDPTDGKSRTQWLVKTYIQDEQFKLEDLGRGHAALTAFERFKRKLPVEQRELSRLNKLRDLEALVDPFIKAEERARLTRDLSSATGREKRRLEEWKARDESVVVQEGKGIPTIAVPMTEFASCWWGRGTQWCTAADKDNAFNDYHKDAPLIVIVCPDGAKFQINVTRNKIQFMDNTDKKISKETILMRWDEFQSLLYWVLQQNGKVLEFVPKEYRNLELYSLAVEQNGQALVYVPDEHRTPKLCRLAVEQNGLALYYVPGKYQTPELYRLAVEQNGHALQYIPKEHRTPELCRLAVEQDGRALAHVPNDYKNPDLCRIAIQQHGESLLFVPEEYRTPELYRLAVEQNGETLKYVPIEYRTPELCRLAVEQNGEALGDVPTKLKTPELYQIAVEQNGIALQFVPNELRTPELCQIAIEQNGLALQFVPGNKRTLKLCRIAVEYNGEALQFVPVKQKTPEFLALIPPSQPKWHPDILQGLQKSGLNSCLI
jgi:Domain of unknown function (DUF4116)